MLPSLLGSHCERFLTLASQAAMKQQAQRRRKAWIEEIVLSPPVPNSSPKQHNSYSCFSENPACDESKPVRLSMFCM